MSTHNGYVKEFPFVRIDAFTPIPNPSTRLHPLYHFLTHAHTDHLVGLDSPHFTGTIYMTPVTNCLVRNTVTAPDRVSWQEFGQARSKGPVRKFDNLFKVKRARQQGQRGVDQIREIHLNQPITLTGYNEDDWVRVTAIDANHCLGSCMYLFEGVVDGSARSCLVTGDLRAEPWYLDSLKHNPLLAPFLAHPSTVDTVKSFRSLDCIYLDTSNVTLDEELVPKEEAVRDLINLINKFPRDTKFFLNSWTWGYEDMLKGIFHAFGHESIHLDWYKHKIFTSKAVRLADPILANLGQDARVRQSCQSERSRDPRRSPSLHLEQDADVDHVRSDKVPVGDPGWRFHACERYWKCDEVWSDGQGCYTWPEQVLQERPADTEHWTRDPNRRSKQQQQQQQKKLVRPGTGEYLRRDNGQVGKRHVGQTRGDQEGHVVYINPVEMMQWTWNKYKATTEDKIHAARDKAPDALPTSLLVPLARHSTLPELQRFVALFRPQTLYPLTISSHPLEPARNYLSMPSLFSKCLAPGGEERLKQEAKEYVKQVKLRRGIIVTSSPEDDQLEPAEESRWLGSASGDWEKEMRRRGLNIEGGQEVFEEVLRWSKEAVDQAPSLPPQNGGVRNLEVEMIEIDDDELDNVNSKASVSAPASHRKLTYGRTMSSQSSNDSSIPTTPSTLLPSALPRQISPLVAANVPPPQKVAIPPAPVSRRSPLRKSVTFAPSPPKASHAVASPTRTIPLKRTRSLPIPPSASASPAPPVATPAALEPTKAHLPSTDRPVSLPSSAEELPLHSSAASSSQSPGRSHSHSNKRSKENEPSISSRDHDRERLVLSLQRTLQGKLGSNGQIVPFTTREREVLRQKEKHLRAAAQTRVRDEQTQDSSLEEFETVPGSY
ncbi:uncharacterized protein JCM15063_004456 [Sporobolomyces koalae]|uniref:uncharacterized protein n=1 Tax=Sporobolomyces koalae TaxID=500713 RepID=UPI00317EA537